ncbi:kumamolisin [Rhizomicrobium palustre]|uniref:Kumamolisin n=1 Tax=Rhizomicrobium palustre TaxID=189966 RepID=A0A846N066_9PROT|nr:S53 family peptidase [Rhizomicrobium palustre]NIK89334.1 kumamolisin [Rhizomicrobium palustre]
MPSSILRGSERTTPPGLRSGPADPNVEIEVSLYLKDEAPKGGGSREDVAKGRTERLQPVLESVTRFAKASGLSISNADLARRLVQLKGPVSAFESAFGTTLSHFEHQDCTFRGREGVLSVPEELAPHIEAVLGLDNRPAATAKIVFPKNVAVVSFFPNEIVDLYGFPKPEGFAKGQCIGLIELGGGYREGDTATAFKSMDIPPPEVVQISISGASSKPEGDRGADGEVALDIQVAGAAAPGARLAVYFAPNTDQGFVDAITAAVHDAENKPSVLSISWGAPENTWTVQAIAAMNSAFADAAALGVTVCVASGDSLASDGESDGAAHVDFPASSPLVLACGGTTISAPVGRIATEIAWNSDGSGTGGGFSRIFSQPEYQSLGGTARGVPDVAANADPRSGYRILVEGQVMTIGGTSAAAPLWAGLFALLNAGRGTPIGQPHTLLYQNPSAFRDITVGDNKEGKVGFDARPGWDAVTGLGSPNGEALVEVFGVKPAS